MTRKKKNRKVAPSNGTPKLSKEKLRELRALKEQRTKKHKGAKPGSRNAQEAKVEIQNSNKQVNKDKRTGSKKPITLIADHVKPEIDEPILQRHLAPKVELKKIKETITPEQELSQLENNERLMALLDRHEQGELLTGKDAKFFNRSIARHQQLCEILGIDDEFEEQEVIEDDPLASLISNDLANEWLDDDEEK
jgi:ribosome assembly protein YihI (activator of Der GTPase)